MSNHFARVNECDIIFSQMYSRRTPGYYRAQRQRSVIMRGLLLLIFAATLCGGSFAAFFAAREIYETAREAVLTFGAPSMNDLPAIKQQPQAARVVTPPNIAAGERVNVLVMGIDRRPGEKCPCRSDTLIVTSLDPKTGQAGMLTIPRDLYVPIPGVGETRINQALWYGDLYKVPGGGPTLAKQTVELNLGRKIHFYVLVDFAGFRKVVDTLGGIDIDVPKAIDDPTYPDDNFGIRPLFIPAGKQHMNGDMALAYARTRHKDGDFGRSKRQLQVIMAVRDRALKADLLPKLPQLIQQFAGSFETDITPQEIIALAPAAAKVKTENIKTGTIDQSMTVEFRTTQGADVLWMDRAKVGRLVDEVIPQESADAGNAIQNESARILILNGTNTPALGERTAKFLQTQGLQITAFGNADRTDYSQSVLIDYAGNKNVTVAWLANVFRINPDNIRRVQNVKSDVEIRLILGSDWTPPQ